MGHGVIHSPPRHSVVHGPRHGTLPLASSGIAGVTFDPVSGNSFPANAVEWALFSSAVSIPAAQAASTWNCQESSASLGDSVGLVNLTPAVAGITYQNVVPNTSRRSVRGVDGTANQRFDNTTNAPNASLVSVALLMYLQFPTAPAATRGIAKITSVDNDGTLRWTSGGLLRLMSGNTGVPQDTTQNMAGHQGWVVLAINNTAGTAKVYSEFEKFSGTYALPASGTNVLLIGSGGAAGPASNIDYLYAAQFTGAGAELSDAQWKTVLLALGASIPWT